MGKPTEAAGLEALHRLKSIEPPQWLKPSPPLSEAARAASQHLFSSLRPHVRKSPFDQLLVDGYDAEQIWQQIDLLTQPLVRSIRRQVKHWENNPEEFENLLPKVADGRKKMELVDNDDDDDGDMDVEDDEDEDMDVKEDGGKDKEKESEEDEEEEGEEEEQEEEEKGRGIEDKFLKIKELQEHLEEEEARHYGLDSKKKNKKKSEGKKLVDEDDDHEDDEEMEEDELDLFGGGGDEDEEDEMGNARYEDFFGKNQGGSVKKKSRIKDVLEEDTSSDEEEDSSSEDEENDEKANEQPKVLSTHEKQLQKIKSEIEKMEKANLDPKTWTMQGEVTAANRPKNSALEVDLDFEHNVRPVPVITEEITYSLEEIIKKRIVEGNFNDVKKAPGLPSKAPRELKKLDENKSDKGLADVYEEEYVQQTNPAAAPLSFSDEQKTEASTLFKKICLKLDALSHFHFAPKPVIEDMSIQSNVPALGMEEITPIAVSDAAMLAPEEVFSGNGNVKAEAELTQEERKRRRAKKKRKFKAETAKKVANKKAREAELQKQKKDGDVEEQ